ncbi:MULTISPECIES: TrkH family potassium uptake protein [unclassified Fusibacter]|uniref:TrkH family potassium uptake protein n=1 Tax=unclassified Fusibacter TaxID=2624464 RepID=UPI001010B378|nr:MULTISPECIES: TrkH family potassium uptake protein [unclassified Fusibacter]MCK8058706.1 TrkH family potassium uptake protein [Fusibacter sp. A2]NPE21780.1 Trk family potassium uptake protein [Fusibacter sp. A1]RXV61353.1 Trk family potassium uptake protein [Fusibacter sp. A1]
MSIVSLIERSKLKPAQVFVVGFAAIIMIGAILLNLPIVTVSGERIGFVNALFTATSAVCVTGLVVVDTGTYWNVFGQSIILLLIQIGGLGFMTMATLISLLIGRRISLQGRLLMQESLNHFNISGVVRLTKYVVLMTFLIEAVGAFLLSFKFIPLFGRSKGIFLSVFHAVSAFCNAGFDLMGNFTSLTGFVDDVFVNTVISLLIIIGGLGFAVILDLLKSRSVKRLSLNTKLVLSTSAVLLLAGFVLTLIFEWTNPGTLGTLSLKGKALGAMFVSVTTRTAGFNTVPMELLRPSTLILAMALMFIGGSPGSTAGGIKTTTIALVFYTIYSVTQGKQDTEVFRRRINRDAINRALAVLGIGITVVVIVMMVLSFTEHGQSLTSIMFETFSAYGTVGLSIGLSGKLSLFGKLIVAGTMFMGRLGGLTIVFALANRQRAHTANLKYPEEKVTVG